MKKTILKALEENQKLLTDLDVKFFMGKMPEVIYKKEREQLRRNVKKIIITKRLKDLLKLKKTDIDNIINKSRELEDKF